MSDVVASTFKKYDTNGDGKLSKDEFGQLVYDLGYHFKPEELKIAFDLLDANGSGSIDLPEFLNFWKEDNRFERLRLDDQQLQKLQKLSEEFRSFDSDKSGQLDNGEFKKMCDSMEAKGWNLKAINFSLEALDLNRDGLVSFNEYVAKMIDLGALDKVDGTRPIHG